MKARLLKLLEISRGLDWPLRHGDVKRLSEYLGVSCVTIWRDFKRIQEAGKCPHCGNRMDWRDKDEFEKFREFGNNDGTIRD